MREIERELCGSGVSEHQHIVLIIIVDCDCTKKLNVLASAVRNPRFERKKKGKQYLQNLCPYYTTHTEICLQYT